MVGKSSVSALHEYCAKNKWTLPTYDYIEAEDGGFVCRITMDACTGDGIGRSKRDAKHAAAGVVIKKLRYNHPDIDEIPQAPISDIPTSDMYAALRDYCLQNDHPLPVVEIVQQAGTPDAPEFTALCQVASIKRYATSEKKKDAKQLAAMEVLHIIMDGTKPAHLQQVATLESLEADKEYERRMKFKTYRELTDSKIANVEGVKLSDRHNYFTTYFPHLKQAAWEVMCSKDYSSAREQALEVLKALKLTPFYSKVEPAKGLEPMTMIELDCDYDCIFVNFEEKVYDDVLTYFREMLD